MCRESVSSILKDGESCAAAKPSLVTLENSCLPPTGGLDDVTGELPKARDELSKKLISINYVTKSMIV